MDNVIARLQSVEKPTKSEQRIIKYLTENPIELVRRNLTQIAHEAHASNSAVIRLCQKLGYQGFSEFKFDMSRYILSGQSSEHTKSERKDTKGRCDAISGKYVTYIQKMASELDYSKLTDLARLIVKARMPVIIGYNRTAFSARQCSYRLSKIGVANKFIDGDIALMADYSSMMGPEDLTIIFSITGASMYLDTAKQLQSSGTPFYLISMNPVSTIRKYATETILLPRISRTGDISFLDDQALFFIFVEMLISEVANLSDEQESEHHE